MNDPFYEETKTETYDVYHDRSVKEIFRHMRDKLNIWEEKKSNIFSANVRKGDMFLQSIAFFTPLEEYGVKNEERQLQWMP